MSHPRSQPSSNGARLPMLSNRNVSKSIKISNQAAFSWLLMFKDYDSPHLVQVGALGIMHMIGALARL